MRSVTLRTVNLDCSDAHAMARFYGGLLGWEPTAVEPDWVLMRNPQGGTGLSFQRPRSMSLQHIPRSRAASRR